MAIAAAAALLLAACGGDNGDNGAAAPDDGDDTTDGASAPEDTEAAEDWPDDDLRFLVGAAEGGGLDTAARLMQGPLSERLGVNVVVENHEGAQLSIAQTITHNDGDDCSIMNFTNFPIIMFAEYTNDLDWSFEDYYPVAPVQNQPSVIVVPGDSPLDTIDDLIEEAQSRPGELTASVSAITSTNAVGIMAMEDAFDIDVNIIDYDGGSPARQAVLSGEVDFSHTSVFAALPLLQGGELKVLAAHQSDEDWEMFRDVEELSDVPTLSEATGEDLGTNTATYGIVVNQTCVDEHPDRYQRLVDAAYDVLEDEQFLQQLEDLELDLSLIDQTPEEYHDALVQQKQEVDASAQDLFGEDA